MNKLTGYCFLFVFWIKFLFKKRSTRCFVAVEFCDGLPRGHFRRSSNRSSMAGARYWSSCINFSSYLHSCYAAVKNWWVLLSSPAKKNLRDGTLTWISSRRVDVLLGKLFRSSFHFFFVCIPVSVVVRRWSDRELCDAWNMRNLGPHCDRTLSRGG